MDGTKNDAFRWCDEGIQTVLDIMVAEPSGSLATVPPRCLLLPHLTAFLGAASPLVGTTPGFLGHLISLSLVGDSQVGWSAVYPFNGIVTAL